MFLADDIKLQNNFHYPIVSPASNSPAYNENVQSSTALCLVFMMPRLWPVAQLR